MCRSASVPVACWPLAVSFVIEALNPCAVISTCTNLAALHSAQAMAVNCTLHFFLDPFLTRTIKQDKLRAMWHAVCTLEQGSWNFWPIGPKTVASFMLECLTL